MADKKRLPLPLERDKGSGKSGDRRAAKDAEREYRDFSNKISKMGEREMRRVLKAT